MTRQHAPVWDYLRETLRAHRSSGACDERVGPVLDEYLGHLARLVTTREVTLAEGLVLANRVVSFAGQCRPLSEARHAPR
ncbi:hypothetical protein [Methylobacterium sp. D48H]